jgi:hypothetical protein
MEGVYLTSSLYAVKRINSVPTFDIYLSRDIFSVFSNNLTFSLISKVPNQTTIKHEAHE